ncbi:MAG TPA: hypothetical protein DCZ94_13725 [Lentisphaeria bacterium]|nr:MAG: hypothetical protein A2X48_11300 [Lentisphaerae bacterium GWF2_49_21]HBC88005.1 hypothetical protein [Lentisphaeria bacterium]
MKILTKDDIKFEKSATGVLNCKLKDGTVHEHLHCITLFPLTLPEQFISVIKEIDQEIEEIGIMTGLEGFDEVQKQLVRRAMDERYFVPEILDISKLKTKQVIRGHGFDEWEITTDRGKKIMYLFNPRENMSVNNAGVIILTDIEKNRYKISNLEKLPEGARAIIEGITM